MDPLEERIAQRMEAARARAAGLRARVPEAATLLRARGARRVRLFGSLAHGLTAHERTDVDLAVDGMDRDAATDAAWDLEQLLGCRVDVVCVERASPSLLARIEEDGLDVAG